jgi:hypothetical protein
MTRKGKIARLPQPIREQINRRLQNGDKNTKITEWLNTLLEVNAVLAAEFESDPINETNLSNWKLGGYRDWEAQQEALAAVRQFGANAAELTQATGGQLADQLALCLTARIAVELQRASSGGDDAAGQLLRLRQLCGDLVALRKGDQNAQWLRIEREKLDLELRKGAAAEAARQREIEKANKDPKDDCVTKEALDWVAKEMHLL